MGIKVGDVIEFADRSEVIQVLDNAFGNVKDGDHSVCAFPPPPAMSLSPKEYDQLTTEVEKEGETVYTYNFKRAGMLLVISLAILMFAVHSLLKDLGF